MTKEPTETTEEQPDDFFAETEAALPPVYLDRTIIESYATCPFQGWARESGLVSSTGPPAESGHEVHRVLCEAIADYVRDGIPLRDYMEAEVRKTRTDVQPSTLWGLRPAMYQIDRFFTSRAPEDVIAFQQPMVDSDGPNAIQELLDKEMTGQFAWEVLPAASTRGPIMATSEIDVLLATPSKEELHEIDWKSGRKQWMAQDVKDSFQFPFHAWLLFKNFPDLQSVLIQVWMTRLNSRTPVVQFTRKIEEDVEARILESVESRRQAFDSVEKGGNPVCWPDPDKCLLCPALLKCPAANWEAKEVGDDPIAYAQKAQVLQLQFEAMKKKLRAWVDEKGELRHGTFAFGTDKPKPERKPVAASYVFYTRDAEDAEDEKVVDGENLKDALVEQFKQAEEHGPEPKD